MIIIPYIIMSVLAIIFGQIVGHLNKKLPPVVSEQITYKKFFKEIKQGFRVDVRHTLILLVIYNMLIYFLGNNVTSYLYTVIIAALMIVTSIDIRYKLIPDEVHIVIGFVGIINFFINLSNWYSYVLGAVVGFAIFFGINLIALIFLKKDGMGFGDVKLMSVLGFMFGIKNILVIALLSFLFGALVGIMILIFNRKEKNVYMAFGPFIALGTLILMFIKADYIIELYITFCSYLGNKITDIIYFFIEK